MSNSQYIQEIIYQDIDPFFRSHPITKDVTVLSNVDAIKRSVKNLVLTNKYEKPYSPNIFTNLLSSLFENFDPILILELKDKIKQILQYEPRIILKDILISNYDTLDRNGINITIIFIPINNKIPTSIEIFLTRVR